MNKPIFTVHNGVSGMYDVPPEEYAALWGGEPAYDRPPMKKGDGVMFYNFGSDKVTKDKQWLIEFAAAIDRQISCLICSPQKDAEDLTTLKHWVLWLANEHA